MALDRVIECRGGGGDGGDAAAASLSLCMRYLRAKCRPASESYLVTADHDDVVLTGNATLLVACN